MFFTFIEVTVMMPMSAFFGDTAFSGSNLDQQAPGSYITGGTYAINPEQRYGPVVFITSIWTGATIVLWFLLGLSFLPIIGSSD